MERLNDLLPDAQMLKSKSGEECLTWTTPESWDVKKATLTDSTGTKIVDFADNPMHLMQYCSSFKGKLTFNELNEHLHYSEKYPDSIPFIIRKQYLYRKDDSWAFSLPYNTYKTLNQNESYFVDIDVEFGKKDLCVLDLILPGTKKDTIFFAAHSDHPGMVNDGIAGIGLLIQLFGWLKNQKNRNYTYRLIVGPEFYAAATFLAKTKNVEDIQYGFFLDMMVHPGPMGFATSYTGNSKVDYVAEQCIQKRYSDYNKFSYRESWGNDEMFYDGPDFKIPTVGIGRTSFAEYHLDADNLNTVDKESARNSYLLLKDIVNSFERDRVIKRKYSGPLYLNRYDLYIDAKKERGNYRHLQYSEIEMDGKQSTIDIAKKLNIDIEFVNKFADDLVRKGLATYV